MAIRGGYPRHRSRFATYRVASQQQLKKEVARIRQATEVFILLETSRLKKEVDDFYKDEIDDDLHSFNDLEEAYYDATGRSLDNGHIRQVYADMAKALENYGEKILSLLKDIENGRYKHPSEY
jgi:DNA-binding GntR family transcriptional regulator